MKDKYAPNRPIRSIRMRERTWAKLTAFKRAKKYRTFEDAISALLRLLARDGTR